MDIKQGDIYYADLNTLKNSNREFIRPVLIVQSDITNMCSSTVSIVLIVNDEGQNITDLHAKIIYQESGIVKNQLYY